ncbi:hypothetical protein PVAP13_9KG107120 [Panicum virgatum]|uniref:Uncharacterized protein n=1 Tax=Panicum virgatum TaxID=38727 RepID=A0A8T0NEH6_PANVG|nr:hypothetical protein PVAP13_9KG107120 [Panicum virgatum]
MRPLCRRIRLPAAVLVGGLMFLLLQDGYGACGGDGDGARSAPASSWRLGFCLFAVCVFLAKGRPQDFPAWGFCSGLLMSSAVAELSSGQRGVRRRWRIASSFLLVDGIADVLSTESKRCDVTAWPDAAEPKLWSSSTRRMEVTAGLRRWSGGVGVEDRAEDFLGCVRIFSLYQGVLCNMAGMYCTSSV